MFTLISFRVSQMIEVEDISDESLNEMETLFILARIHVCDTRDMAFLSARYLSSHTQREHMKSLF